MKIDIQQLEKLLPILRRIGVVLLAAWLFVERYVLIGARFAGRWLVVGLHYLGIGLARAVNFASPYIVQGWGFVKRKAGPHVARFWEWSAPGRARAGIWILRQLDQLVQYGDLNQWEFPVLQASIDTNAMRGLLRTRTRVDVGMWFRKGRVWVCPMSAELVLIAEGTRSYVSRIPYDQIDHSRYNHVTGELVFAPNEDLEVKSLRITPLEALELLRYVPRFQIVEVA